MLAQKVSAEKERKSNSVERYRQSGEERLRRSLPSEVKMLERASRYHSIFGRQSNALHIPGPLTYNIDLAAADAVQKFPNLREAYKAVPGRYHVRLVVC